MMKGIWSRSVNFITWKQKLAAIGQRVTARKSATTLLESTARAANVSEEDVQLLKEADVVEVRPMAVPSLRLRLKHAVLGCRPLPHHVIDRNSQRLVEVGRICPLCWRQFPIG